MTEDRLCAAGERCLGFDRREDRAELLDGHPVLCESCLSAGERAPAQLVRDYVGLEQKLVPSSTRSDGQPSGSAELRVPIRLDVEALQREIWWLLTSWEEVLRDKLRLSDPSPPVRAHPSAPPPRPAMGVDVRRAAAVIEPQVRLLANLPPLEVWSWLTEDWSFTAGFEAVLAMVQLHRRAVAAQGLTDARPELCSGVPCKNPDCDLQALYRDPGEDTVHCGACGWRYTAEEYRDWTRLVSASVKQEA